MPLQFLVLGRFRADTDLDTIRVIIHGEAVAFRVRHHEGVPTRFVRTRRCRLAAPAPAIRIVLILPSLFERLVGVPRLEGFADDRAVVVPQEVVAVNLLLYVGAIVPLLREADGLVEYLA